MLDEIADAVEGIRRLLAAGQRELDSALRAIPFLNRTMESANTAAMALSSEEPRA